MLALALAAAAASLIGGAGHAAVGTRAPVTLGSQPAGTGWLYAGSAACRRHCTVSAAVGSRLTVRAKPVARFDFRGWTGPCAGMEEPSCTFTVDGKVAVTAEFERRTAELSVAISPAGGGSVSGPSVGISCPGTCARPLPTGTVASLVATPAQGFRFAGWSGPCSGTGACTTTVETPSTATATFEPIPQVTLTVSVSGGGTVAMPGGTACTVKCSVSYPKGTTVRLTQTAAAGWSFSFWDLCGSVPTCTVKLDQATTVGAFFGVPRQNVEVRVVGTGKIFVSEAGTSCDGPDARCDYLFPLGTWVTLTATPTAPATTVTWVQGCPGATTQCNVFVDANKKITASFA